MRPAVRRALLVTVALTGALQLSPGSAMSAAPARPPLAGTAIPRTQIGGTPVAEQYAHIAGEPGGNEVDLALRTRLRRRAGGRDADGLGGGGLAFEAVSATGSGDGRPDPCAEAGGELVSIARQEPDLRASSTTPGTICAARGLIALQTGGRGFGAEQVAALLRRVTLPGGIIRARPRATGLAGLDTTFWVDGAEQPPVDLVIGAAVLHARFTVTGYRWSFGDGTTVAAAAGGTTTGGASAGASARDGAGPSALGDPGGPPDRPGSLGHVYQRRGVYTVSVQVIWSARGFLGGSPAGSVDGLVSSGATTYRVDELYSVLAG